MELIVALGSVVFAIIAIVKRRFPKLAGWWAVGLALALSALGVVTFDINGFAAMSQADLDAWVADVLAVFATFTSSGVIHKAWERLSL